MRSTHFKPTVVGGDKTKKAILGQDSVDWPAVPAASRSVGGTAWITLEQEKKDRMEDAPAGNRTDEVRANGI